MDKDIDQEVREIKARIDSLVRARARSEYELDHAKAAKDKALARLQSEFGVQSGDGAKTVLTQLEADLLSAIDETKSALAKGGA